MRKPSDWIIFFFLTFFAVTSVSHAVLAQKSENPLSELGKQLFFHTGLSKNRNLSCGTCHQSNSAFTDSRKKIAKGSLSEGTSMNSFGRRNTPTLTYASLIPPLTITDGVATGGLFFDGRSDFFEDQIQHPLFDPSEMDMENKELLLSRVMEDPNLTTRFKNIFGDNIFNNLHSFFNGLTSAIASFERSQVFFSFDSKYDRFLQDEYKMTPLENKGYRIFFSDVSNCMNCHLLQKSTLSRKEPFSDHRYHNIGVPKNPELLKNKYLGSSHIDLGLAENSKFASELHEGKFRTPTLRNAAVTPPYMHNGVFQNLSTAIQFYNRHLVKNKTALVNPETNAPWGPPEVSNNIDRHLLKLGQPLDSRRILALVSFLRLLTDERYESLLKD